MSAALQLVEREVDTEELEHDQLVTVYYRGLVARINELSAIAKRGGL